MQSGLNELGLLVLAGAVSLAQFVLPVAVVCVGFRLWSKHRRKVEAAAAAGDGDREPLSDRLCRLRLACGLSQDAVAAELGVSRQAVRHWESGAAAPDAAELQALATLYGVTPDELARG